MRSFFARCLAFIGWLCIGLSERIALGSVEYGSLQGNASALIRETAPLVMQGDAKVEELEVEVLSLVYIIKGLSKMTEPVDPEEMRVAIREFCEMARFPSAPDFVPEVWPTTNNLGEFQNG